MMILWIKLFPLSRISGWCSADGPPVGRQWAASSIGWHKLDKSKGVLLNSGTSKSNNKGNVYFPATYSNLKNSGISSGR